MARRLRRREAPEADMPAADAVLVTCPSCKAWPMAANLVKPAWGYQPVLQFTCPKCHFSSSESQSEREASS